MSMIQQQQQQRDQFVGRHLTRARSPSIFALILHCLLSTIYVPTVHLYDGMRIEIT